MDKINAWVLPNNLDTYTKHLQDLVAVVVALIRLDTALTAPCLIIICETDSGSTSQMPQAITRKINGSETLNVTDLQYLGLIEQPNLFSAAIHGFLTRVLHTTGQQRTNNNDNNDWRAGSSRGDLKPKT